MRTLGLLLLACLCAGGAWAGPAQEVWTEVDEAAMDVKNVTPLARAALDTKEFKWKHAQTEHFVVHFENGIFAAKVARMAEFFYDYISADLKGVEDRVEGRSHILVFRKPQDWEHFIKQVYRGELEWSASMVQGPVMYLQQMSDAGSSADVLGHEMTHLVVNRFLTSQLPIWLNEGTAEWYEEFAYAEFKGVKKSKRTQFKNLKKVYPLEQLLGADQYPKDLMEIHTFYETAKHLVAFLQLRKTPADYTAFVTAVDKGTGALEAIGQVYGLTTLDQLNAEFLKFVK